jgi:hypothetical protein
LRGRQLAKEERAQIQRGPDRAFEAKFFYELTLFRGTYEDPFILITAWRKAVKVAQALGIPKANSRNLAGFGAPIWWRG